MVSRNRVLAFVVAAGLVALATPGDTAGPFQYHSLTPCRIVDTRNAAGTVGNYGGILTSGQVKVYPIANNCLVSATAKAVTLNVTAVTPSNQGRFTVYPSDIATPTISTINFPPGTTALANGAIVPLATTPVDCPAGWDQTKCDLAVMPFVVPGTGTVHLVLDVTGYFE